MSITYLYIFLIILYTNIQRFLILILLYDLDQSISYIRIFVPTTQILEVIQFTCKATFKIYCINASKDKHVFLTYFWVLLEIVHMAYPAHADESNISEFFSDISPLVCVNQTLTRLLVISTPSQISLIFYTVCRNPYPCCGRTSVKVILFLFGKAPDQKISLTCGSKSLLVFSHSRLLHCVRRQGRQNWHKSGSLIFHEQDNIDTKNTTRYLEKCVNFNHYGWKGLLYNDTVIDLFYLL